MRIADRVRADVDRISRLQVRAWAARGMWAALDQGLFAVSNFLVNVMLARALSAADYGAFVASYAMLIAAAVIHGGLLTDPMIVFGAERYAPWFADYMRLLRRHHQVVTGVAALVLAAIAGAVGWWGYPTVAAATIGMAVALPFVLLSWLARRACYARGRADWAAMTSAFYCAIVVGGVFVLNETAALSAFSAQMLMAAAGLIAALPALALLGRAPTQRMPSSMVAQVRADHWAYGRWYSGSQALNWLTGYGWYLLVPVWGGLEASASLRALLNLLLPIMHVDVAMNGLFVPAFVRARNNGERFWWVLRASCFLFALEAVVYGVALLLFGGSVMTWLYDGRYVADPRVLALAACLPLLGSVPSVLAAALEAHGQPQAVFRGKLAAVAAMGVAGFWMISAWGVTGAVAGMVCAAIAQGTMLAWAVWGLHERTRGGTANAMAALPVVQQINPSRY
jgi:O-antigen/teichoic acid export membrane protein